MRISDWSSGVFSSDLLPTQLIPGEFFCREPGTYILVQFGTQFSLTYGLEATQLLFDGSYFVGLKASKVDKDLSIKSLERSRIETAIAVSKAYYGVLVTDERLQLADANISRLKKQLDETEALCKNRSEERRVGKECVSTVRSRGATYR